MGDLGSRCNLMKGKEETERERQRWDGHDDGGKRTKVLALRTKIYDTYQQKRIHQPPFSEIKQKKKHLQTIIPNSSPIEHTHEKTEDHAVYGVRGAGKKLHAEA